ncbi:MAG TPA: ATP-binding protein [Gaiella sp.]|uniref:ATP-binding protein n=1 Tax=Gaiella sp. TaxID=2663207 RepID=UPI002D7F76A2|nr:ATP-binding protein [Gaiella sp.]HET9287510.1 ATP-binding protein [Gaiella sp.]
MSASTVTLVIPAKTEYLILARLALAGIAREVRIDETALADLKLAVTEACGNAIRHAHPSGQGVVSVRYAVEPGSIEIRVEDEGPGITSGAVPPEPSPDELSEGGMGLAIIDALVDELEIGARAEAQGTLVLMRKRLLPA